MKTIKQADQDKLVNIPNQLLSGYHARVYLADVPEAVLAFFEANKERINGEVLIVRSKDDEGFAAYRRNNAKKALFLFGQDYWVGTYFSGTCAKVELPKGLLTRYSD